MSLIFTKLRWKNFLSTGNIFTELDLDKHSTVLISGINGSGKCVHPSTSIEVRMDEETRKKYEEFLSKSI